MELDPIIMRQIEHDLSLNLRFIKGSTLPVRNCWHFMTDGNAVAEIFTCQDDFKSGMNRIYVLLQKHRVIVLAFCLMDTHVHFLLYGAYDDCNRFIHDYVKRTSMFLSQRYGRANQLRYVPVHCQEIRTDRQLKNTLCYIFKNPTTAGITFSEYDYPWSSAALMQDYRNFWSHPSSDLPPIRISQLGINERRKMFHYKEDLPDATTVGGIVHPGEYIPSVLVKRIFGTAKAFHFYMCSNKDAEIESQEEFVSRLSIPMQEMREHKKETCLELFGHSDIRRLNTAARVKLAKVLKSRYASSSKQILRLCGLNFENAKDLL